MATLIKGLTSWLANESINRISAGSTEPVLLPPSTPRVPAEIPKGQPVDLDAKAWSHETWQAADFAPTGKIYYSYQVITAPDGNSALIRANGDLDGDGVLSTFEWGLRVVMDGEDRIVTIDERITETQSEE